MNAKQTAKELLDFIEKSPSCFHGVENIKNMLLNEGFEQLFEGEKWNLYAGGKYFTVRNGSSVISFKIPADFGATGLKNFLISASHSDSPCFKVKENPEIAGKYFVKLNVEKYGGMLMNPWFDRPLSLAGRVVVKNKSAEDIGVEEILINFDRDLLMIPNLAIHLNRDANEGHKIAVQDELLPVISANPEFEFKTMVAEQAGVGPEEILGYDLFVYNRDKGVFWGEDEEFIASPRLDDLECAFTTLKGFIEAENPESITVHCVFDNEEVGSQSRQGAASTFLNDVLRRINLSLGCQEEEYYEALAKSFMVSADNAHSLHPNYPSVSDPVNVPVVNNGPVIKFNASQKYTSDSVSGGIFKQICQKAGVTFQIFTNNSNIAGGSTLGNISTSQVSLLSVDVGLAQWAMHSPNESAGAEDVALMISAMKTYYESSIEF